MTTLQRVRCLWQNWPGAPGYTNFYESASVVDHAAYRTFFDAVKAFLPTGLTVQVPGVGDIIEDTTGAIVGAYSFGTPAIVTGTSGTAFSGGSGACVDWLTTGLVGGRRPMGRSFLVPMSGIFENNGSLLAASITTIQTAATALITALAGELKIWSRPREAGPGGVPTARAGSQHAVVSARVPDLAAQLRSRRT